MTRHGKKPPKIINDKDQDGLSAQGLTRAQGLVKAFGKDSSYDIGYIMAEHPDEGIFLGSEPEQDCLIWW